MIIEVSLSNITGKRRQIMSSQMSVHDEIKEQHQKTKDMTFKGKLSYFWYYYKIHAIVIILAAIFIISFVHQLVTNKEYGFYAAFINALSYDMNDEIPAAWAQEFLEYSGLDPDEYQVYMDTTVTISEDSGDPYAASNREKLVVMMQVGEIDAVFSDTKTFEGYAQAEYFYDLTSVFSPEELAPYEDYLYYTDRAAIQKDDDDILSNEEAQQAAYALNIDHRDPSSMTDPVAVGICIPSEDNKLADAGYYNYLAENNTTFQGHPSQVVMGIPISSQEPQLALKFLEYLGVTSSAQ